MTWRLWLSCYHQLQRRDDCVREPTPDPPTETQQPHSASLDRHVYHVMVISPGDCTCRWQVTECDPSLTHGTPGCFTGEHHSQHEVLSERRYVDMSMKQCWVLSHTVAITLSSSSWSTAWHHSVSHVYLCICLYIYASMNLCTCIYVDMYLIYVTHEGGVVTMTILILCVTGLGFSSSSVSCHAFASCWICIIGRLPRDSYNITAITQHYNQTTRPSTHQVKVSVVLPSSKY